MMFMDPLLHVCYCLCNRFWVKSRVRLMAEPFGISYCHKSPQSRSEGKTTQKRVGSDISTRFRYGQAHSIRQMINDIRLFMLSSPFHLTQIYQTTQTIRPGPNSLSHALKQQKLTDEIEKRTSKGFHSTPFTFHAHKRLFVIARDEQFHFSAFTSDNNIWALFKKALKKSSWSLSKVKSVCPFFALCSLSDFHKIVSWIYEYKKRSSGERVRDFASTLWNK